MSAKEGRDRERRRESDAEKDRGEKDRPRRSERERAERDRERGDRDRTRDDKERERRERRSERERRGEEGRDRERRGEEGRDRERRGEEGRDRERRERRGEEKDKPREEKDKTREEKGREEKGREERRKSETNGEKSSSPPQPSSSKNSLGITYTMYSAQRKVLEKYDKRTPYYRLVRVLTKESYLALMGGKLETLEQAAAARDAAEQAEELKKKSDRELSSADIMKDFYTTLLTYGGVPVPSDLRKVVNGLEHRYKEEKKREKELREEKERREAQAKAEEVEEKEEGDDEGDDYGGYDDDFENPEDDQPDLEIAKLAAIMAAENQQASRKARERDAEEKRKKLGTPQQKQRAAAPVAQQGTLSHGEYLARKKKRDAWEKQYKRAQELLRLVPLEPETIEMIDIPPLTEYDLYIRNFGSSNTQQCSTQVPDQNEIATIECQTVEITSESRALQVPEDLGVAARAPHPSDTQRRTRVVDSVKLWKFLSNCDPVFRVLLDESAIRSTRTSSQSSTQAFSSSVTSLNVKSIVRDRGTIATAFNRRVSATSSQYLLTVHGVPSQDASRDDYGAWMHDGLILVWNMNNPIEPHRILVSGGAITTATFSAFRSHIVFAGSENGSVYSWDLREPAYNHTGGRPPKGGSNLEVIRLPTYSTDIFNSDNHTCPIRRILPVGYNNLLGDIVNDSDAGEQVATLDDVGNVSIWIVVEIQEKKNFVSQTDFGLNIFGRVKLYKTATVHTIVPPFSVLPSTKRKNPEDDDGKGNWLDKRTTSPFPGRRKPRVITTALDIKEFDCVPPCTAFDLEFQPDDTSQFLVATNSGMVLHCSRFGDSVPPAQYRSVAPQGETPRIWAEAASKPFDTKFGTNVLCLHYRTTLPRMFAAGYDDGSFSVYSKDWMFPLFSIDGFTKDPIVQVRWEMGHKGVLWMLDGGGMLYMFNFMEDDPLKREQPVLKCDCTITENGKKAYPTDFELSPDVREPKMAISYDSGRVDIHILKEDLVPPSPGTWLNSLL